MPPDFLMLAEPDALPTTLDGWLQYIEAQHHKTIAMGLERVNAVIANMALVTEFCIINVAGTNGKGSTCATLEKIYTLGGYQVGCYTSPHLLRYNERVRINGKEVSDADLCAAFAQVEQARGDIPLTYFEFGTLAAVWLFVQKKVDIAILEIGLGGRLDAVNAFNPDCAIVTNVDIDHVEFLGDTRELIAQEKAGVFRTNKPAICGDKQPPQSLIRHAETIGAQLKLIHRDFDYDHNDNHWTFCYGNTQWQYLPLPTLFGEYQFGNISCALTAVSSLNDVIPITHKTICQALSSLQLTGRYQYFSHNPDIIFDVAHNPNAAQALAANLSMQPIQGRTFAVFSMLADKDIAGVLTYLADMIDVWYIAAVDHYRAAELSLLQQALHASAASGVVKPFNHVSEAYLQACKDAMQNDRIIVFGSFYTVAEVIHHIRLTSKTNA